MAWNEPGGGNKDPWSGKSGGDQGPPDLDEVVRKLQERLNRQERLGAMGEMSAQLAHQMRTPLSTALLYTFHLGKDNFLLHRT